MPFQPIKKEELKEGLEIYVVNDSNIINENSPRTITKVLSGSGKPSVVVQDSEKRKEVLSIDRLRKQTEESKPIKKEKEMEIKKSVKKVQKKETNKTPNKTPNVAKVVSREEVEAREKIMEAPVEVEETEVEETEVVETEIVEKIEVEAEVAEESPVKEAKPKKVAKVKEKKKAKPKKEKVDNKIPFKLDKNSYSYMRKPINHDSSKEAFAYVAFPKDQPEVYYSFQVYGGTTNKDFNPYGKPLNIAQKGEKAKIKTLEDRKKALKSNGYNGF